MDPARRDEEGEAESGAGVWHEPVMVQEVVEVLSLPEGAAVLDGTVGGGGHAEALLRAVPGLTLVGVDRDPDALAEAARRLAPWGDRVRLVRTTFDRAVGEAGIPAGSLDGILLDLGVSSHQLDEDARGFAFRRGVPLDMRMEGAGGGASAADLLNEAPEEELGRIFREFAEEPRWRRLAREVVKRRESEPFSTSDQLVGALSVSLGRAPTAGEKARVFQGLRMEINREVEVLERALPRLRDALAPGGVIAVLSWHSLEDRIVKHRFREWSTGCTCPPGLPFCACGGRPMGTLCRNRPMRASAGEVERNPRARSALLRAWRKNR